jgi:alkylation response protein AidB-like acyl-CoA dehydrogenase
MNFSLAPDHLRIQSICRELAADFATRAAPHDRDASAPVENYEALRQAGLFGLTIPKEFGGWARDCWATPLPRRSWPKAVPRQP